MKLLRILIPLLFLPFLALAQVGGGSVVQYGPVTAGDSVTWKGNGLVQDGGAAPVLSGTAAGGSLQGTYPNPTIVGGVTAIGQSHLPLILPSGNGSSVGSIAQGASTPDSNHAVTLAALTSLPAAYPNAYVYLPANQINNAQPAGWYYATFQSQTSCTVYANTYTGGTPTIPAALTGFPSVTGTWLTQTIGAYIPAYALAIAANTLGPNDTLDVRSAFSYNNSAGAKLYQGILSDGTNTNTIVSGTQTTSASSYHFSSFQNEQNQMVNSSFISLMAASSSVVPIQSTVNTALATTLTYSLRLAVNTDTVVLKNALIELIKGAP